jgi:DNA-directed RNA polymerase specialized sigma24 family protein
LSETPDFQKTLDRYFSGDQQAELVMVDVLRRLGETYALRRGLKGFDVDAAGVDFAAYILIERAAELKEYPGNKTYYLRRAARWFVANLARNLQTHRTVPLMVETETAQWELHPEAAERLIAPSAQDVLMEALALDEVDQIVERFPKKDQDLYQRCFKDGLNCQEASEDLGWTAPATRKRMERLRKRLKAALDQAGFVSSASIPDGSTASLGIEQKA